VLELGCGPGEDTVTLSRAGLRVIAIDRSTESIAKAQAATPGAEYHCQDMRAPFPASAVALGVVLGSLSLHYFAWSETVTLVERIHDVLRVGGILLCRLNSTEDHHHGASGHPAIETNYYLVEGEPKRFFDRASIDRLFAKRWRVIDIGHHVVDRYACPKALWEVILEKTARPAAEP
jgi:SAM-dependent methyltransferase